MFISIKKFRKYGKSSYFELSDLPDVNTYKNKNLFRDAYRYHIFEELNQYVLRKQSSYLNAYTWIWLYFTMR
jgi:hypothetical protein